MPKNHYSHAIEETSEDIELIQENLNVLRIETDDCGVEETKNDKDASDNSADDITDNLTDFEDESDVEKPYENRNYTTTRDQSKWIDCDMETLENFLSGDAILTLEDKIEQLKANILPVDILSAEEIEKQHPNFPPKFYQYFEEASRKRFEVLLKEETEKPVVTEGDFKITF